MYLMVLNIIVLLLKEISTVFDTWIRNISHCRSSTFHSLKSNNLFKQLVFEGKPVLNLSRALNILITYVWLYIVMLRYIVSFVSLLTLILLHVSILLTLNYLRYHGDEYLTIGNLVIPLTSSGYKYTNKLTAI